MEKGKIEYIKIADPPDNIEHFIMKCGFGAVREQDALIATGEWFIIRRGRVLFAFNERTHEAWTITPLVEAHSSEGAERPCNAG